MHWTCSIFPLCRALSFLKPSLPPFWITSSSPCGQDDFFFFLNLWFLFYEIFLPDFLMSSIHPKAVKKHPLLTVWIVVTPYPINPKTSESILHIRERSQTHDLQEKLGCQADIELYIHSASFEYFHSYPYESHADVIWLLLTQPSLPYFAQRQAEDWENNDSGERGRAGGKTKEIWVAWVEWMGRANTLWYRWAGWGWGNLDSGFQSTTSS